MSIRVQTTAETAGVSHRWFPAGGTSGAFGTLDFGNAGSNDTTVYLHSPAEIDEVIAELVALRVEMVPSPVSPEAVAALADSIADANPPHHVADGEQACQAADNKSVGYICTAQDSHDGPDHIAYKPGGGEYHRWLVAAAPAEHPFDAGEGSRELAGPGRELLREAIDEQDAADEQAASVTA